MLNGILAAQACSIVSDWDNLEHLTSILGAERIKPYESDTVCAVHIIGEQDEYLIFRGTFSAPGWILDIDFKPIQYPDFPGKIHEGFAQAYNQFQAWYEFNPDKKLWIAGHSLGGALAVLAGSRFPSEHTITFGSPSVGNKEFATTVTHRQTRYVHDLDPVPHIAPFVHTCEATYIGSPLWSSLIHFLRFGFQGTVVEALEDHKMEAYLAAIS
jgi:predicted lipase